jgi:membrane protein DedA with SNARE-associated domain
MLGLMTPGAVTVAASVTDTLTGWIGRHGAYAVLAIMAIDALLPAGGELTMLYAGALAAGAIAGSQPVLLGHPLATGLQAYLILALAGTVGYLGGALVGWAIGRAGGRPLLERHGRWLHVTPENLERAEAWFDRHGAWAIFLSRLTPVIRSFISIPAGALGAPPGRYTVLTLAGSAIWCFGFAGAGWALGTGYQRLHHAFGYVDVLAVAAVAALLVGAVVIHRRRRVRV